MSVYSLESLDAKLMMSLAACREIGPMASPPQGDGKWTEYMKAFSGRLYRPDVAPADAAGTWRDALAARVRRGGPAAGRGATGHAPPRGPPPPLPRRSPTSLGRPPPP